MTESSTSHFAESGGDAPPLDEEGPYEEATANHSSEPTSADEEQPFPPPGEEPGN
jgi:hypothetical protein